MTFRELGLSAPILSALEAQGYTTPSPIQEKAIPPALEGRDILGCAQTGTGKTCAFATPILQRLDTPAPGHPIRTLILTPTRELAIQINDSFVSYGKNMKLRSTVVFGGVSQKAQVETLRRGIDILVATPGRLGDLYQQGHVNLAKVEIFVLDEADRMLDMGFIHDVKKVLQWLPKKKQTLLFSATMPKEISELVDSLLVNPFKISVDPVSSPVDAISQTLYFVDKGNKTKLLAKLVRDLNIKSALVFTRTKHGANKVVRELEKERISAAAIHGNKSQTARQQALADFKAGKLKCLVATDIAARGIDIDQLSHVFNYNLPEVPETYVHRIGRTGRAGREGDAIAFCDFGEKPLLKDLEKLMGRKITVVDNHPYPLVVLEAPKKDKFGRPVNEEDEEARNAAKELRNTRNAVTRATADVRRQGLAHTDKAADNKGRGRNSGNGAPAQRNNRGVRPGTQLNTGDSMPKTDLRRPDAMAGDHVMDATARLLAPRKPSASTAQSSRNGEGRSNGGRNGDSRNANRNSDNRNSDNRNSNTGRSSDGKSTTKLRQDGTPYENSPAKKPYGAASNNRGGQYGGNRGRGGRIDPTERPRSPGAAKDSTENSSLMKPFYLDFK